MRNTSDAFQNIKKSFFIKHKVEAIKSGLEAEVYFDGSDDADATIKRIKSKVPAWQLEQFKNSSAPTHMMTTKSGPIWVLRPSLFDRENQIPAHDGKLKPSDYGQARDLAGFWWRSNKEALKIAFHFINVSQQQMLGAFVGLGLAQYKYSDLVKNKSKETSQISFSSGDESLQSEADALIQAMNISRHLTNMPGGDLNPKTFSEIAKNVFKGLVGVKVDVWDESRLKKENMGLLLGVGQGSANGSRLIHIRYRPTGGKKGARPRAFIGKGVTFDTGGLDIKPASGMRYMKKDMAGAGTVMGLAYYVAKRKLTAPCDFYLAVAENAVSATATRPGDIHYARNGLSVEIHNTDAEGRLVMADAIDVAVTQKGLNEPIEIIDVSTLTGAMRVSLGLDVAGYFSNDDELSANIEKASQEAGELAWRMPLVRKYKNQLNSSFADLSNCSDSGFGGAISAALFLEAFVKNKPWLHFDVMSWNNSASGAMSDGGNAQTLQILARYLEGVS